MSVSVLANKEVERTAGREVPRRTVPEDYSSQALGNLSDVLELLPHAIAVTDSRGHIQLLNSQAQDLFGCDPKGLVGAPIELLIAGVLNGRRRGPRLRIPSDRGGGAEDLLRVTNRGKNSRNSSSIEIDLFPLFAANDSQLLCIFRYLWAPSVRRR